MPRPAYRSKTRICSKLKEDKQLKIAPRTKVVVGLRPLALIVFIAIPLAEPPEILTVRPPR